jgi:hypothetical protein
MFYSALHVTPSDEHQELGFHLLGYYIVKNELDEALRR